MHVPPCLLLPSIDERVSFSFFPLQRFSPVKKCNPLSAVLFSSSGMMRMRNVFISFVKCMSFVLLPWCVSIIAAVDGPHHGMASVAANQSTGIRLRRRRSSHAHDPICRRWSVRCRRCRCGPRRRSGSCRPSTRRRHHTSIVTDVQ